MPNEQIHIIFFYNVILLFCIVFILRVNTVFDSLQIVDLLAIFTHLEEVVPCYIYYMSLYRFFRKKF